MWRMVALLPSQSDRVPPPSYSGPASHTRGLHPLSSLRMFQGCGVSPDTRCPATLIPPTGLDTLDTYKTAIACGRLISVSVTRTLLRVASLRARPHNTGDTGCSEQGGDSHERAQTTRTQLRKALPMRDQPLLRRIPMPEGRQGEGGWSPSVREARP